MTPRKAPRASPPDVSLRWRVDGVGFAHFTFGCGSASVEIATSDHADDALRDLLRAARDLQLGSTATFVQLFDEPGGHRVFFSDAGEEVYVQIVSFEDMDSPDTRWAGAELRWDGHVRTRQLIDAVIAMAERARRDYPDGEYERRWGFPFPDEELGLLRADPP